MIFQADIGITPSRSSIAGSADGGVTLTIAKKFPRHSSHFLAMRWENTLENPDAPILPKLAVVFFLAAAAEAVRD